MNKTLAKLVLLATSALVTCTSFADTTVYKWVDKNGVVSFSQQVPTDVAPSNVTKMTIESLPIEQQRSVQRMLVNMDSTDENDYAGYKTRMAAADLQIEISLAKLTDAEHHLTQDSIPTGEDRIGSAGANGSHHARLRDSYFNRVARLQADVEKAKQELQDAYTARDNLHP